MSPSQCMDGEKGQLSLFAELKPRLSVVHAVLHVPKNRYEKGFTINVLKTCIELKENHETQGPEGKDEKKTIKIKLQNVSLIPASCHGLQWVNGDGIHFRMQIHQDGDRDVMTPVSHAGSQSLEEKLEIYRSAPFSCSCRMCGQQIVQKKTFRRVMPLPSSDWHEFADQMYCHPHKDDVPHEQLLSLAPQPDECLVGEHHLLLHQDSMPLSGVVTGTSNVLHCKRCKIIIGKLRDYTQSKCYQLNLHYLSMGPEDQSLVVLDQSARKEKLELWFTDFLVSETSSHGSCRILVESETDTKKSSPYILLWILESNVVLYSGNTEVSQKQNDEVKLPAQPILKILYRDCLREKNKVFGKQWREDFTVHSVTLPHDLCKQLLQMLIESSVSLPRSLQSANGFYVGYLKRRIEP